LLLARKSPAQQVFDSHVHLWEGEKSLRQYETEAKTAGIDLVGFWWHVVRGPNQALSGHPDEIRESNRRPFRPCKEAPRDAAYCDGPSTMMAKPRSKRSRASPRLASRYSKLHPHTQKFEPLGSAALLAVVTRAGNLGMIVLVEQLQHHPGRQRETV